MPAKLSGNPRIGPAFGGAFAVSAPATLANLGPGFDVLGLAVSLRNRALVWKGERGLEVEVRGEGADVIRMGPGNPFIQGVMSGFRAFGGEGEPAARVVLENRIPLGVGLGSSAAAAVSGLLVGAGLAGARPRPRELLGLAVDIEGHPDNAAPCLLGGLVAAWMEEAPRAWRLPLAGNLLVFVLVPPEPASTEEMRRLLPSMVPLEALVRNLGRCLALVEALRTGEGLFQATRDELHQPHRLAALPSSREAVEFLRGNGIPAFLAGAGPAVAWIAREEGRRASWRAGRDVLEKLPGWRLLLLRPSRRGAVVTGRV